MPLKNKICEICGKEFNAYVGKTHKGRFCSKVCRGKGHKGDGNPNYKNAKIIKECNSFPRYGDKHCCYIENDLVIDDGLYCNLGVG